MIVYLALLAWLYLFFGHGKFWSAGPELPPVPAFAGPEVDIVVPARDEAASIAPAIASLLAQDYAGKFRVILVDDSSTDGTAEKAGTHERLTIVAGRLKPPGWSGKLWALAQGVETGAAPLLLFADADIVHDPRHLSALVAPLEARRLDMVSEMVRLNCRGLAERALVPAFVYFFQMLYPFARVNDRLSRTAAAAGGTVLIRRAALARIGGLGKIRDALIDDVALAREIKKSGTIYLGHSGLASSIRAYPDWQDIWAMISRTAFTQLRYSAPLLLLTLAGLTLVWLVPLCGVLLGRGGMFWAAAVSCALGVVSYFPILRRYRQSYLWALAVPLIALFYMAATAGSAWNFWRGAGTAWKNRVYMQA